LIGENGSDRVWLALAIRKAHWFEHLSWDNTLMRGEWYDRQLHLAPPTDQAGGQTARDSYATKFLRKYLSHSASNQERIE